MEMKNEIISQAKIRNVNTERHATSHPCECGRSKCISNWKQRKFYVTSSAPCLLLFTLTYLSHQWLS